MTVKHLKNLLEDLSDDAIVFVGTKSDLIGGTGYYVNHFIKTNTLENSLIIEGFGKLEMITDFEYDSDLIQAIKNDRQSGD